MSLRLPSGKLAAVEVDTGSNTLILNDSLAAEVGTDPSDPGTRKVEGQDETGYAFTRYFATVRGDISVTSAPEIRQSGPEVMFQEIIYDGLVGDSFLRQFIVTYGLPGNRMIFARPQGPAA